MKHAIAASLFLIAAAVLATASNAAALNAASLSGGYVVAPIPVPLFGDGAPATRFGSVFDFD